MHVLYVLEDLAHHAPRYGEFDKKHVDKVAEYSRKVAKKTLDQFCGKYLGGDNNYIKHVVAGDPAQEILKFIEKLRIDIVVMATRGAKGHFPFGSVTEKVVKNSTIPVVPVPAD